MSDENKVRATEVRSTTRPAMIAEQGRVRENAVQGRRDGHQADPRLDRRRPGVKKRYGQTVYDLEALRREITLMKQRQLRRYTTLNRCFKLETVS